MLDGPQMRILLVAPFLPHRRAPHGGGVYLAALAESLGRRSQLGLAALMRPEETQLVADPQPTWSWQGLLPFAERPPGRGRRRHQLRMLWRWRNQPLVAAKHWHAELPALLQRARAEFAPDVVLVELAQMAQYLPFLQGVPTILTDHEAGCPANTTTGLGAFGDRRDQRLWRRYTQRYYPMASLLQAVTAEDAATLAAQLGREVLVRPPVFAVPRAPIAPEQAPPRALFLGDYSHHPNREAAATLVRDVYPLLRAKAPTAELWLAGPHEDRLHDLAVPPGVRVLGYVPDLGGLFAQVRLLLAPLWSGGGFRMKALAALAHGLPVVTNALGGRGCSARSPACTIAEGPAALAAATVALLHSAPLAAEAGRAAFAWARGNLGGEAVAELVMDRAQRLLGVGRR